MEGFKLWLSRRTPSFRIYFLIFMACIVLNVSTWLAAFILFGYYLLQSLDEWIIKERRDQAHDYVMDVYQPDPEDPKEEIKADWYWESLSSAEAIIVTRLSNLIRLTR
jgi:hypothetical protein